MTLAQLEALEERRIIALRHERFNAALVASAVINMNRTGDSEPVSPFDFLPGFDEDPAEAEKRKFHKALIRDIRRALLSTRGTAEEIQAEKARMVERMRDNGIEDPEAVMAEAFPDV